MTFAKRKFEMRSEQARESLLALVRNLPLDDKKPLQVVIEEYRPVRKLDQNALYWSGPLRDIAEQAFLDGRQYSAEIWAHYFKVQFLPEDFDPIQCKDGYVKWQFDPMGERILTGSTTQLTVAGFSAYLEQIFAFGGSLGVEFSTREQA